LQAVVAETPRRLAASLHEQPASTSATSARRPASPRRALRWSPIRVPPSGVSLRRPTASKEARMTYLAVHNLSRHVI